MFYVFLRHVKAAFAASLFLLSLLFLQSVCAWQIKSVIHYY